MAIKDITELFVNNGVAIAVIIYFMFRDYKFMTALTKTLQELTDAVKNVKELLQDDKGGENNGT